MVYSNSDSDDFAIKIRIQESDVRCFCCGEIASSRTDGPIPDDAADRWTAGVLDVHSLEERGCRAGVCCWPCFWSHDPDMWIAPEHWDEKNPVVPFEKLPVLNHSASDCWDETRYAWPT